MLLNQLKIETDNDILVVSDIHLGLGDKEFKREKLWLKTLLEIEHKYEYIIFNGDIFETWKYGKYSWTIGGRTSKIDDIIDNIPGCKEFLKKDKCKLILGNHDFCLKDHKEFSSYKEIALKRNDKTFLITHGNNASDSYSFRTLETKKGLLITLFDYLTQKFLNLFTNPLGIETKLSEMIFVSDQLEDMDLVEYSKTNEFKDYDYLILGHSHIQMSLKHKNGLHYLNGGSQIENFQGVIIDDKPRLLNSSYF